MSASSGRDGFCAQCGIPNNEHASLKDSKCKKCGKFWQICQSLIFAQWRICFQPCHCDKQQWPDKAKAAIPLQPDEYAASHGAEGKQDEYDDDDDELSSQVANLKLSRDILRYGHGSSQAESSRTERSKEKDRKEKSSKEKSGKGKSSKSTHGMRTRSSVAIPARFNELDTTVNMYRRWDQTSEIWIYWDATQSCELFWDTDADAWAYW
ncbi:hypothetical protein PG989_005626 [Apiospora arundinis]